MEANHRKGRRHPKELFNYPIFFDIIYKASEFGFRSADIWNNTVKKVYSNEYFMHIKFTYPVKIAPGKTRDLIPPVGIGISFDISHAPCFLLILSAVPEAQEKYA